MSLTDLILRHPERAAVRARLDQLVPPFRGTTRADLLVPPRTDHATLVGVGFDYAARLELAYRAPHAKSYEWVAARSLPLLGRRRRAAAKRAIDGALRAAKRWPKDVGSRFEKIAYHAARLAPLDAVYRTGMPPLDDIPPELDYAAIAREVSELLAASEPLWRFASARPLHLNPVVCGNLVGGADADIIADDTIIELKTRKHPIVERDHLRQLVGYTCLAALAPPDIFPRIEKLAVFLPRFGLLREFELIASVEERAETAFFLAETWNRPRRDLAGRAA